MPEKDVESRRTKDPQTRDIIVIGGSTGSLGPLKEIVSGLPADLPAAVFVVVHALATGPNYLGEILTHQGPLRAALAIHGEQIRAGRIYVAPPDNHLMLRSSVQVVRGPKENNHRPAVDALFRTAARHYGPRVIGVVLSGHHDCGTAGMLSIKARNGVAIVQQPAEALVADMPQSVIDHVQVDHVLPAAEIGPLLARLVREPPAPWPASFGREILELEGDEPGVPVQAVCPLCSGAITASEMNGFQLFRCHVGHAFSEQTVLLEQDDQVEGCLWSAVRALEESAAFNERLIENASPVLKRRFAEKAENLRESAARIRSVLLGLKPDVPITLQDSARSVGLDVPQAERALEEDLVEQRGAQEN